MTVGLACAACVLVWPYLAGIVGRVNGIGHSYGLQPISALTVLGVVYAVRRQQRRQRDVLQALDAVADARAAGRRVEELERLVAFSSALLRARDQDSILAVTQEHLPALMPATLDHAASPLLDTRPSTAEAAGGDPQILKGARDLLSAALQNSESFRKVYENSRQDALTGCFNRTHAIESLENEMRRANRAGSTLSLVMFDLDHFKTINDQFGHLCGDDVLAAIGARIKTSTRTSDVKCRYGGEEFLIILPDTPLAGARQVAENLRRVISKEPVPWGNGSISVTASFGFTQVVGGETNALTVVARTDMALYQAKRQGRNCVVVAEAPSSVPASTAGVSQPGRLTSVS
jgi:diguanylate cyclase (GGDEF)-like protein